MNLKENNRITTLNEKMLHQPRYVSIEQALIITQTYKEHEQEPIIMKRAHALSLIHICGYDLIFKS